MEGFVKMVLMVVIKNNGLGGYILELINEQKETVCILDTVKEYSDYLKINDNIVVTVWNIEKNINKQVLEIVRAEINNCDNLTNV